MSIRNPNGVGEYLVWRTLERRFDWFALENENYVAVRPDARGLLRSKTFPGFVLDVTRVAGNECAEGSNRAATRSGLRRAQEFVASLR
jgi:hypothetical protein